MIVAGLGFRASATAQSLAEAFGAATKGRRVDALATALDKAETAAFKNFAKGTGLPVRAIPAPDLVDQATATQSSASTAARGTGSVAEAAALAGAGKGATLLTPRKISSDRKATCALAEGGPT